MKIIVCIKQVPGTNQVEVDPVTGVLKREGVESKLNPYDLFAIEAALSLPDEHKSITALTMGPPQAKDAVMEAIYMGCDKGVLVSDKRFSGADVLATAYTLSQAIKIIGDFDIILCGKQTTDGDTAQVGAELAEFLGVYHANNVLSFKAEGEDSIIAEVNRDSVIDTLQIPMPCVVCVDSEINTPRLPSYKRKRDVLEYGVTVLSLNDFLDRDENNYGLSGSPTQVEKIFPPKISTEREMLKGTGDELSEKLYSVLKEKKYI